MPSKRGSTKRTVGKVTAVPEAAVPLHPPVAKLRLGILRCAPKPCTATSSERSGIGGKRPVHDYKIFVLGAGRDERMIYPFLDGNKEQFLDRSTGIFCTINYKVHVSENQSINQALQVFEIRVCGTQHTVL